MAAFHQLPFTKFARSTGQHIAYSKLDPSVASTSASRTFVCVADLGEIRYTYRFLAPLLAQAGHTAYMVDLRGMGDSSSRYSSYSVESCTEDIDALVESIASPVA
ncbi:hypothetical protein H257_10764 [Aphanomyces astaci]|uniref:Serine aminopeptidase S33 domain-containing protein n=1 Tax=Aphanomyces astaci TaxID=112090 RepID=W4G5S6_APHAT|nr:hypothetical protein H257_10764 [Aphanomyces astaci]ETV74631.1 hypothetical protein H257_10764 [Aphanomyces astaci]|eukprot:XP_009835718.1 hypothetical protein H257_10764 [Aphanomyces astaci]